MIELLQQAITVLDELEGAFDEQTYQEKARMEFDSPDDHEYSVNITAKQLRSIGAVLSAYAASKIEVTTKDGK